MEVTVPVRESEGGEPLAPLRLQTAGDGWRRLETAGDGRRRLENIRSHAWMQMHVHTCMQMHVQMCTQVCTHARALAAERKETETQGERGRVREGGQGRDVGSDNPTEWK